jgi:hypothetical protein
VNPGRNCHDQSTYGNHRLVRETDVCGLEYAESYLKTCRRITMEGRMDDLLLSLLPFAILTALAVIPAWRLFGRIGKPRWLVLLTVAGPIGVVIILGLWRIADGATKVGPFQFLIRALRLWFRRDRWWALAYVSTFQNIRTVVPRTDQ